MFWAHLPYTYERLFKDLCYITKSSSLRRLVIRLYRDNALISTHMLTPENLQETCNYWGWCLWEDKSS